MPNRILRDTTDSETVNRLSAQAEILFYRLMMKADDYGVFHAKPSLIKAALFPLRLDSVREADLSRWLAECEKAGLIAFYDVDSKPYLWIVKFGQRMRNMKKRFPSPPDNLRQSAADCGDSPPVGNPNQNPKTESESEGEGEKQPRAFEKVSNGFIKPTQEECENFFEKCNQKKEAGARFFVHYQSVGWKDGNSNEITDWAAKAQKWILTEHEKHNHNGTKKRKYEPMRHDDEFGQL